MRGGATHGQELSVPVANMVLAWVALAELVGCAWGDAVFLADPAYAADRLAESDALPPDGKNYPKIFGRKGKPRAGLCHPLQTPTASWGLFCCPHRPQRTFNRFPHRNTRWSGTPGTRQKQPDFRKWESSTDLGHYRPSKKSRDF
jgi:hypothetical protein